MALVEREISALLSRADVASQSVGSAVGLAKQFSDIRNTSAEPISAASELSYVLCAETAIKAGDYGTAEGCLTRFFSSSPARTEYLSRAYFCQALCENHSSRDYRGINLIQHAMQCISLVVEGMNIALEDPVRCRSIVYDATVHYMNISRRLMRDGLKSNLIPSMMLVIKALEDIDDKDYEWRIRHMINLSMCYDDSNRSEDAIRIITSASDLSSKFAPSLRLILLRQQIHLNRANAAAITKLKADCAAKPETKCTFILQSIKSKIVSDAKQIETDLNDVFNTLVSASAKPAAGSTPAAAGGKGAAAASAKTPEEEEAEAEKQKQFVQEVLMPVVAESGLLAAENKLIELAEKIATRAASAAGLKPRVFSELTLMFMSHSSLRLSSSSSGPASSVDDKFTPFVVSSLIALIKRFEKCLELAVRTQDADTVEKACAILWAVSLPLLQPSLRNHLKKSYQMASDALEELGSTHHLMRVQFYLELAQMYMDEDFFAKASMNLDKALSLDYVSSEEDVAIFGLTHPLDRYLLPLREKVRLRINMYHDPDTADEEALRLIEQAKTTVQEQEVRKGLLIKASQVLNDSSHGEMDETLKKKRSQLWIDIAKTAWTSYGRFSEVAREAGERVLNDTFDPKREKEMAQDQARICFILAEVALTSLKDKEKQEQSVTGGVSNASRPSSSASIAVGGGASASAASAAQQMRSVEEFMNQKKEIALRVQSLISDGCTRGEKMQEGWIVINAATYAWNYHMHLFDKMHFLSQLPVLTTVYASMLALDIQSSQKKLFRNISHAYANALIQRFLSSKAEGGGSTDEEVLKDFLQYKFTDANNADLKKAEEVCDKAIGLNKPLKSKDLLFTLVKVQRLKGTPIATFPIVKGDPDAQILMRIEAMRQVGIDEKQKLTYLTASIQQLQAMPKPVPELCVLTASEAFALQQYRTVIEVAALCLNAAASGSSASSASNPSGSKKESAKWKLQSNIWYAQAERLTSRALIAFLQACKQDKSTLDSMRREALHHLALSAKYAHKGGSLSLLSIAARDFQLIASPLSTSAASRKYVVTPLEELLPTLPHIDLVRSAPAASAEVEENGASGEQDDDDDDGAGDLDEGANDMENPGEEAAAAAALKAHKRQCETISSLYSILCECFLDSGRYEDGLHVVKQALDHLPRAFHKSVVLANIRFLSLMNQKTTSAVNRLKEYDAETQARALIVLAESSNDIPSQYTSYQEALSILSNKNKQPTRFAELSVEFALWMLKVGRSLEEVRTQLLAAADTLCDLEKASAVAPAVSAADVSKSHSSAALSSSSSVHNLPRSASSASVSSASVAPSSSRTARFASSVVGGASGAPSSARFGNTARSAAGAAVSSAGGGNMEVERDDSLEISQLLLLSRIHLLLSSLADNENDKVGDLLLSHHYIMRIWETSMHAANKMELAAAQQKYLTSSSSGLSSSLFPGATMSSSRLGGAAKATARTPHSGGGAGSKRGNTTTLASVTSRRFTARGLPLAGHSKVLRDFVAPEPRFHLPTDFSDWIDFSIPDDLKTLFRTNIRRRTVSVSSISRPETTTPLLVTLLHQLQESGLHLHCLPVLSLISYICDEILPSSLAASSASSAASLSSSYSLLISLERSKLLERLNLSSASSSLLQSALPHCSISEDVRKFYADQIREHLEHAESQRNRTIAFSQTSAKNARASSPSRSSISHNNSPLKLLRAQFLRIPRMSSSTEIRHLWSQIAEVLLHFGHFSLAKPLVEESLMHARSFDDRAVVVRCMLSLAKIHLYEGDFARCLALAHEVQKSNLDMDLDNVIALSGILSKCLVFSDKPKEAVESMEALIALLDRTRASLLSNPSSQSSSALANVGNVSSEVGGLLHLTLAQSQLDRAWAQLVTSTAATISAASSGVAVVKPETKLDIITRLQLSSERLEDVHSNYQIAETLHMLANHLSHYDYPGMSMQTRQENLNASLLHLQRAKEFMETVMRDAEPSPLMIGNGEGEEGSKKTNLASLNVPASQVLADILLSMSEVHVTMASVQRQLEEVARRDLQVPAFPIAQGEGKDASVVEQFLRASLLENQDADTSYVNNLQAALLAATSSMNICRVPRSQAQGYIQSARCLRLLGDQILSHNSSQESSVSSALSYFNQAFSSLQSALAVSQREKEFSLMAEASKELASLALCVGRKAIIVVEVAPSEEPSAVEASPPSVSAVGNTDYLALLEAIGKINAPPPPTPAPVPVAAATAPGAKLSAKEAAVAAEAAALAAANAPPPPPPSPSSISHQHLEFAKTCDSFSAFLRSSSSVIHPPSPAAATSATPPAAESGSPPASIPSIHPKEVLAVRIHQDLHDNLYQPTAFAAFQDIMTYLNKYSPLKQ